MPGFPGVDFLEIDSLLNDDERLVRQTTREFVDREVLPIIEKHNREGTFPFQLVGQMAELGFFGANLEGYGCAGMSNVAYGQVMQELERGDSGLRSFVSVQSALVMYPIYAFGSAEQKQKWLPALHSARAIGCFGLTEPQFGSNPAGMLTRAVRRGQSYVLNGEKMWITNGSLADVAWYGQRPTTDAFVASSSKRARLDSNPGIYITSYRCAPRSLPAFRSPIARFPRKICCRVWKACADRSPALPRLAMGSAGARLARRWLVTRLLSTMPGRGGNLKTSLSPHINSFRTSSSGWLPKSPKRNCWLCTQAG